VIANPPRWPGGARCAAAITFDIDAESMLHSFMPGVSQRHVSALAWAGYDRIAVPRILDVYRDRGLRQTFFMPGWCMEQFPELAEAIVADGHELGLHGYLHEDAHRFAGVQEEREVLHHALATMEAVTGRRPEGWRGPLYSFSEHTAGLLAEAGFRYDSTLMGDDVPYVLETDAGELIEVPVDWTNDDWPQYAQSFEFAYHMPIRAPERALEVYRAELAAARRHGGLWIGVWHPFLTGRPSRLEKVVELLDEIDAAGDVWLATLSEIAEHVRAEAAAGRYTPRRERLPMGPPPNSLRPPSAG
jgi:peptidoglycan/xylan/chitin deacetylase (PgdA/CDA1 family)